MILDTGNVKTGLESEGAAGIQETDCPSLETMRVPSFFLYAAEPLGVAMLTDKTKYDLVSIQKLNALNGSLAFT